VIGAAILIALSALLVQADELKLSPAFEHFYNLEYDQAIPLLREECNQRPNDPSAHNHLATAILYREMFKVGALESELVSKSNAFLRLPKMKPTPEAGREFDDSVAKAVQLAEAQLAENPRNTDALYALGISHGLKANYNFLVRKAWRDALRDVTAARKLHSKVVEIDPDYIDARLTLGIHDYLVGSLPFTYRMLGFLAGFHGDREGGIRTLKMVAEKGRRNRYDAEIFLAGIYRRERRAGEAIPLLKHLTGRFPRNYLLRLEMAQMYSDMGDKQQALAAVREVEDLKKANTPGFASLPEEKIAYYKGTILFWYNDLDQALVEMQRVAVKSDELDLNTGILAWMRVGQIYDLKGKHAEAVDAYKRSIALAPESDAAREPKRYIASPYKRTPPAPRAALITE
jgi:tetratricopeptide (TPR) repeat protein